ncbi:MAG: SUMF1/EgtB/PvdO family nonheme iron enzyme [Alphaproteobacteria bacterium]
MAMKWLSFFAVFFVGTALISAVPVLADSIVVPLGLAGKGDGQALQLVQLKTSRNADVLDLAFWNSIKESGNKEDYQAYLEVFPDGAFAPLARLRAAPGADINASVDDVEEVDLVYRVLLNANVRAQPRASATRVGGVAKGALVTVTGRAASGTWLQVGLPDGTKGFLFAELAELANAAPAAAVRADAVQPVQSPAPAEPAQIATVPPVARAARPLPAGGFSDCSDCPEMVSVKAGRFIMGDEGGDKSERPAHPVTLTRDYAIGRFEVTVGQWRACMAAGGCPTLPGIDGFDAESPARNVSWDDALVYTDWLSKETGEAYRLPSEAEWEFAARGGTAARYWWGDDVAVGNVSCRQCGGEWDRDSPLLVGSLEANPYGLFDVSGGVAEWTADCWQGNHKGASADGAVVSQNNCRQRVLRGGSWRSSSPKFLASSSRFFYDADVRFVANGFRVARN